MALTCYSNVDRQVFPNYVEDDDESHISQGKSGRALLKAQMRAALTEKTNESMAEAEVGGESEES
jgi:hypothetical protein